MVVFSAQSKRKVLILDWLKSNVVLHASRKETQFASRTPAFVSTRSLSFNLRVVWLGFGFLLWWALALGQQKYFGTVSEKGWRQRYGGSDSALPPYSLHPFKLLVVNNFFLLFLYNSFVNWMILLPTLLDSSSRLSPFLVCSSARFYGCAKLTTCLLRHARCSYLIP